MEALLVVDMQNDFMPKGALPVKDGDKIIPAVNQLITAFDVVVATQDWHPENHRSFAEQHAGKQAFDTIELMGKPQVLWPTHCVQGSIGAEFHSAIASNQFHTVFRKGTSVDIDSYSGFFDNHQLKSTGLAGALAEQNCTHIHICGLAADYCVYYSIVDALRLGFDVTLHCNATKPIDDEQFKVQLELLQRNENFYLNQ